MGQELALIESIRKKSGKSSKIRLGIGDDCAILRPPNGTEVAVTTDFSSEGIHFRRDWHPAHSAGHRCLARGLSDLAAMGATPLAAFLSIALPAGTMRTATGRRWVEGFLDGLLALAKATGTPLAGGDTGTALGDAIVADIVLTGTVPRGKALLRSSARVGDGIYVTGQLGASAAELEALAQTPGRYHKATAGPHLFPQPRLAVGQDLLRRGLAHAAMDISDGLSTDLNHLCMASGVGAVIDAASLPLGSTLQQALHGGEDYELLFTSAKPMPRSIAGVAVTRIGTVTSKRSGVILCDPTGKKAPLKPAGWEHSL